MSEQVYLTFDDGPDPRWTPQILDLLAQASMHATFFAIGECAQREPALLRSIAAAGHAVGNHTYSHRHPWLMRSRAARAQVREGANALSSVLGREPFLYRPPHGRTRPCMTDEARLTLMHDGQNVHNRPDQLLQVLPEFLRELARKGLSSVACPAV